VVLISYTGIRLACRASKQPLPLHIKLPTFRVANELWKRNGILSIFFFLKIRSKPVGGEPVTSCNPCYRGMAWPRNANRSEGSRAWRVVVNMLDIQKTRNVGPSSYGWPRLARFVRMHNNSSVPDNRLWPLKKFSAA
jgi:hypothetical protein